MWPTNAYWQVGNSENVCLTWRSPFPALIASVPILLLAMLLMQLADPGSVLFRQTRIGRGERPFTMLKLRTMREGNDDSAFREFNTRELRGEPNPTSDGILKLENDPRLLPMSRFLRRFSIDELPQLVNVILGDMSTCRTSALSALGGGTLHPRTAAPA